MKAAGKKQTAKTRTIMYGKVKNREVFRKEEQRRWLSVNMA